MYTVCNQLEQAVNVLEYMSCNNIMYDLKLRTKYLSTSLRNTTGTCPLLESQYVHLKDIPHITKLFIFLNLFLCMPKMTLNVF